MRQSSSVQPAKPLLLMLCLLFFAPQLAAKQVAGWIEKAVIQPGNLMVKAKLDTGAETSSLHCDCVSTFDKAGREWVHFTVQNWRGQKIELERPVVRHTTIKRHTGKSQERMVITLPICVGNIVKEEEVTIVDRSRFKYQLLIGRNFLAGDFLVDSAASNLLTPDCENAAAK